jgi:hypothetical protein
MTDDELTFEGTEMTSSRNIGFCRITNKGKAQQVRINIDWLAKVAKFLATLKDVGFDSVVLTVQEGKPLIIGGKEIGIGIAPKELDEE